MISKKSTVQSKQIGSNNVIHEYCIIGRHVSLLYNVVIGDRTKIMTNSHITGNTRIGQDVVIGVGVNSVNDNSFGEQGYDVHSICGPTIADNVRIGAGTTNLPKIKIGENALIGAGSVVTKDVIKNTFVIGAPAKLVRNLNKIENGLR